MPRTAVATDNFNRAGPALGSNWATLDNANSGDVVIFGSTVACGSFSTLDSVARWVGAGSFANDQYSSAVVGGITFGSADYGIGVIARASADTNNNRDYYLFKVNSTGAGVLAKVVNGSVTNLNTGAVTLTNGDLIEIECEGTTIRACKNGAPLGGAWTVTDSSLTTGNPGVLARGSGGNVTADDWEGGDITAGGGAIALEDPVFLALEPQTNPLTVTVY